MKMACYEAPTSFSKYCNTLAKLWAEESQLQATE